MLIIYRKKVFLNSEFIQISFEITCIFLLSSLFDKFTSFIEQYIKGNYRLFSNYKYIPIKNDYFRNIINKL